MGMGEGGEEDGGMEEWEDDGWGTFETQEEDKNVSSSGADFFDTLEGNFPAKDESEDLFDRLGVGVGGGGKGGKKPSPPPVSANLFGSSMSGGGGGGGGEKAGKEDGGWGDWGDDFSSKAVYMYIFCTCVCVISVVVHRPLLTCVGYAALVNMLLLIPPLGLNI